MKRWIPSLLSFSLLSLAALFATVCTPSEQAAADKTARDVCALIAPEADSGAAVFEKLVHDVAELAALERALLARDAGDGGDAAAARARDGGPDR